MIKSLAMELGKPEGVSSTAADFERLGFGNDQHFRALIAEVSGDTVGMCLFFLTLSSWRGELGVYVQDLYLTPSARGHGIGQQLLCAAAKAGCEDGATHLRLSLHAKNLVGAKFYKGMGMTLQQDEQIYEASGETFETMATQ